MKTIILITLILLMAAPIAANMDVLDTYDRNGDGIIDADERIILDIDIESARLTLQEGFIGDMIAEDGSILLNPETRAHMTTGYHDRLQNCDITVEKKVDKVIPTCKPIVPEQVLEDPIEKEEKSMILFTLLVGLYIFIIIFIVLIIYNKYKNSETL